MTGSLWRCCVLVTTLSAASVTIAEPFRLPGRYRQVEFAGRVRFTGPCRGAGMALLNARAYPDGAPMDVAWDEPNLRRSFAIGLDTHNPPTDDPFNADGNIHKRPEHEVSLHWDGRELANAFSPVAYNDGRWHEVRVTLEHVTAGALVTVTLDATAIYDHCFLPDVRPYAGVLVAGAAHSEGQSCCEIGMTDLSCQGSVPHERAPERHTVFAGAVLTADHQQQETIANLPPPGQPVRRIMLTLSLRTPPGGIDPWDRAGSVYAWGDDGQRYEILRFITPFGREYTWEADVTEYQSLLRGPRRMAVAVGTWVKGWEVGVRLDYYWGQLELEAFRVTNVWSGDWEYGNPADPLEARFVPRTLPVHEQTTAATLRVVVTGHGMHPNTDNAAEFMPARRTVIVNGKSFENLLWTTDNYLNPCRPQGGTWKYDRAGWGPGALVRPWDLDLTGLLTPGQPLNVQYIPQAYVNENAGKGRASHLVEVQLIEYR